MESLIDCLKANDYENLNDLSWSRNTLFRVDYLIEQGYPKEFVNECTVTYKGETGVWGGRIVNELIEQLEVDRSECSGYLGHTKTQMCEVDKIHQHLEGLS